MSTFTCKRKETSSFYLHGGKNPPSLRLPTNEFFSFSQTFHRGVTASLFWDRITMKGLRVFLYHDQYFKQRYDVYGRSSTSRVLCELTTP